MAYIRLGKKEPKRVYERLDSKEKKKLDEYVSFCGASCGKDREHKVLVTMLQVRKNINKSLIELNKKDIINFLVSLNRSDLKNWTKNDTKKIFKRFLKWYYKDLDLIESLEVKEGWRVVSKKKAFNHDKINPNNLLTNEELEKLIRASNNLKWRAIISFLYESAFRPCELRIIRWKDLKFNDSEGKCRVTIVSPKTKENRTIPLKSCVVHLKRWREEFPYSNRKENDYVFPSQFEREEPLGEGTINVMFSRLSDRAKIRKIFPYMLRHSRLTELKKMGVNDSIVAKYGGHSVETSQLYTHLSNEDLETCLDKMFATKELTDEEKNQVKEMRELLIKFARGDLEFDKDENCFIDRKGQKVKV